MRWSVGRSHFPSWAEGPSCETEGIPERTKKMSTKKTILNRNTELCIDLKTILRSDRKAKTHKDYPGVLTRDGREHSHDYAFIVYRELLGALKGLVGRM